MLWESLGTPGRTGGPLSCCWSRPPAQVSGPFCLGTACPERFRFIPCVFGVASRCEHSCLPFWQGEGSPCHPTSLARGPDACLVSMTGVRFWGFQLVLSASPLIRSASPGLHSTVHRPPAVIPKSRFTVFPAHCFQLCRPGGPFLWPPFLSCASELFVSAKCI